MSTNFFVSGSVLLRRRSGKRERSIHEIDTVSSLWTKCRMSCHGFVRPYGWAVSMIPSFWPHNSRWRSRSALPMTDTELNVIAALAIIGLSSSPNTG